MTEYSTLEASTCTQVTAQPFTRLPGKPSWRQKETLITEASEIAMEMHVSYPWADKNGLMAVVHGAEKYLADIGLDYVQPVRPQHPHPEIFVTVPRVPTQQQVKNFEAQNENRKRDYTVHSGFCKGIRENMMKALDARYYKQLSHQRYKYRDVLPRDCIDHLV